MRSKRERANRATFWHCRAMYRNASLHHKPGSLLWNSRLEDGGDLSEGLPTYLTFFSSHFFANHDSISQNMLTFSKHSYEKRTDFRQLSGISRNSDKKNSVQIQTKNRHTRVNFQRFLGCSYKFIDIFRSDTHCDMNNLYNLNMERCKSWKRIRKTRRPISSKEQAVQTYANPVDPED